ncbi:MAG: NlpC/P60 family protein [Clostridia bacterium]|nr:NlpC/P60 family protein [Clostridia bacterium]
MNTNIRRILAALLLVLLLSLPALALAEEDTGTITGNAVNLRKGPGTSYASLGHLYKGDTVAVIQKSGDWYAVSYQGTEGYVYARYVSLSGGESGAAGASSASGALRRGGSGAAVKTLQGNLIMLGYLNDRADGVYGAKTEAAVLRYQQRNGLGADGVAGAKTNAAIQKEVLRVLAVIDTAKAYLGSDYVYGGSSPATGFDCSGLVQYAHAKAGVSIPRVSYEQAASGQSVPYAQLRAGDVVCFNSPVSHVGIYLGGGRFIHSPKTGDVVKITSLSAMKLTAIRRYTGVLAY